MTSTAQEATLYMIELFLFGRLPLPYPHNSKSLQDISNFSKHQDIPKYYHEGTESTSDGAPFEHGLRVEPPITTRKVYQV